MKISVIIPTYNEENYISDCLESLFCQSYSNFEVIVVDDGSTDETLSKLHKLMDKYGKLKVIEKRHLGPALARNKGAEKASGEILVFVDADMTFDKEFLKMLVDPIIKGKSLGTFSRSEYVSNWDNKWARCWNYNQNLKDRRRLPDNYPSTQKVFRAIKKDAFDQVDGFSKGGYTDDWSLSEKLKVQATASDSAIFYHRNPESLREVFIQSRWAAKREYKLGILGIIVALFRVSFLMSIILGIIKSISNREPLFVVFRIVFDFGAMIGILSYTIHKNGAK